MDPAPKAGRLGSLRAFFTENNGPPGKIVDAAAAGAAATAASDHPLGGEGEGGSPLKKGSLLE